LGQEIYKTKPIVDRQFRSLHKFKFGIGFIDENGGDPGLRLRKRGPEAIRRLVEIALTGKSKRQSSRGEK
jgi:hypothetical protein